MHRILAHAIAFSAAILLVTTQGRAAEFYPLNSVETDTVNFFSKENLIEGSGVGYDAAEPHDQIGSKWLTDAPGGFPADYIDVAGPPVIALDLGQDRLLSEISVWGYAASNANGVSEFILGFSTEAEGPATNSSSAGPFFPINDDVMRQSFSFPARTARYVEFTANDNFFIAPGDGSGGETPGGDRVGLGEIAFETPEPATLSLLALGSLVALRRRRR